MKKVIPFVLVIVLLVSVGLVFAEGSSLPGSGWKSGQQAQNVGSASAKVVMTAYEQNGTSHDCGEKTIAQGASATLTIVAPAQPPANIRARMALT